MTDSTENTAPIIEVGDTVYVRPYKSQNMNGDSFEGYLSGKTGVVTLVYKDYDWRRAPNVASIRVMAADNEDAYESSREIEGLTLVDKGPGRFELGVTHPFSAKELKAQRWEAYVARCKAHDLTHQGFSNPATFLADLYLGQDTRFLAELPSLWRKDGSVNPDKIHKLFGRLGLTIDKWAFECPLDPPAEFAHCFNPLRDELLVNWPEVAAGYSRDNMRDSMPLEAGRAAA